MTRGTDEETYYPKATKPPLSSVPAPPQPGEPGINSPPPPLPLPIPILLPATDTEKKDATHKSHKSQKSEKKKAHKSKKSADDASEHHKKTDDKTTTATTHSTKYGTIKTSRSEDDCELQTATQAQCARTIVVVRHGERTDDLFGRWYKKCEDKYGKYKQLDLNMPPKLNPMTRPLKDYEDDTMLTVLGNALAQRIGRALAVMGHVPDAVYASPALRCIQTAVIACAIARKNLKVCIEPGLFENTVGDPRKRPKFMTIDELLQVGFPIDDSYRPFMTVGKLNACVNENNEEYNTRVQATINHIAKCAVGGKGCIIISGHASTVDIAFGVLHKKFQSPRLTTPRAIDNIGQRIPYTASVAFTRLSNNSPWEYIRAALPPTTYHRFTTKPDIAFIERAQ